MKIGFDAKRAFHNFTGLGNYSRFVLKSLSEHYPDNQYLLYTPKNKNHPEIQESCGRPNQSIKSPNGIWKTGFLKSLWRSVFLGKITAKDQLDIFHGLSNELPVIKDKNCRYVLTVHDLLFIRLPHLYHPLDVRIYTAKLKKSCQNADIIVAISEQTKSDLIRYLKVDPFKIKVIYQGAHVQFARQLDTDQKEAVRKKYVLPEKYLLSVGTLEKRKNTGLIIRAMDGKAGQMPPLVLVGKATSYVQELKELVRKKQLENRVLFLHDVAFGDLPAIYQMAEIMIYPSIFEGFGIPVIEAQLSGVPVITSTGSCFAEAGGEGAIYCSPEDPLALQGSVLQILQNPELKEQLVQKGHANTRRFTSERIASEMMNVYKNLIQ